MPAGLIGGTETIIFYSLFLLWPLYLVPLYLLMAGLVLVTVGQRLVWASRHLRETAVAYENSEHATRSAHRGPSALASSQKSIAGEPLN
jgi:hypothetical protein